MSWSGLSEGPGRTAKTRASRGFRHGIDSNPNQNAGSAPCQHVPGVASAPLPPTLSRMPTHGGGRQREIAVRLPNYRVNPGRSNKRRCLPERSGAMHRGRKQPRGNWNCKPGAKPGHNSSCGEHGPKPGGHEEACVYSPALSSRFRVGNSRKKRSTARRAESVTGASPSETLSPASRNGRDCARGWAPWGATRGVGRRCK